MGGNRVISKGKNGAKCLSRSVAAAIKVAHVDALQTFMGKDPMAQDVLFEYNTCFDWGQGAMV
jgi:hypothetical protein